jgi:DNA polymerase III gamma/tau subunit
MLVLAVLIADILYLQEGATERIMNVDIRDRLQELAARVSVERLLQMAEFLKVTEQNLKSHVNKQMLMDALSIIANESAAARLA